MAKRRSLAKARNSRFQALQVNAILTLATLASETALTQALTALADDFWIQSMDLNWAIRTATAGEGPIAVGIANGDLSVSEIKEALNASPVSRSDIVNREHARRPVRRVAQFEVLAANESLNDGKPIRTVGKMYLAEGTELNAYAFNQSGASLTTGAVIRIWGTIYGVWK